MQSDTRQSQPIRVLLWAPSGSGEHYSGPGSFAHRLYSSATSGRFEITLAHGYASQEQCSVFAEQHLIAPLEDGAKSLWRFLRAAKKWLDANANRFDVMHALSGFHPSMSPAYFAQKRGLPAVVFMTSHKVELTDKRGLRGVLGLPRMRRRMAKRLSGLIAMTEGVHDELISYGIDDARIARIPMGIDTQLFHPLAAPSQRRLLRRQLGWPERPTLLYVGVVARGKRPHVLLEAVGIARSRGVECQLVLAGPEFGLDYVRGMKDRSKSLDIESRVIWHGFTREIAPVYRAAEVFGLVSEVEGMPASMVEAMASGLPCIGSCIAGIEELIENGVQGRLVNDDPQEIATALVEYLQKPDLAAAHGAAGRDRAVSRHSLSTVVTEYERLFRRIIAGGPARGE